MSPFKVGEGQGRKCMVEIWKQNPAFPPVSNALGITFDQEGGLQVDIYVKYIVCLFLSR